MMNLSNPNELSNKNAEASKKNCISNDQTGSQKAVVATDQAMKSYCALGTMNPDNTVNLDSVIGRSKFRYKK
jgi:hypothetical protein